MISIDLAKVKSSTSHLKANPPTHAAIVTDPKAFLAQHGVTIDDELNDAIKAKIGGTRAAKTQPSAIHIDV